MVPLFLFISNVIGCAKYPQLNQSYKNLYSTIQNINQNVDDKQNKINKCKQALIDHFIDRFNEDIKKRDEYGRMRLYKSRDYCSDDTFRDLVNKGDFIDDIRQMYNKRGFRYKISQPKYNVNKYGHHYEVDISK